MNLLIIALWAMRDGLSRDKKHQWSRFRTLFLVTFAVVCNFSLFNIFLLGRLRVLDIVGTMAVNICISLLLYAFKSIEEE